MQQVSEGYNLVDRKVSLGLQTDSCSLKLIYCLWMCHCFTPARRVGGCVGNLDLDLDLRMMGYRLSTTICDRCYEFEWRGFFSISFSCVFYPMCYTCHIALVLFSYRYLVQTVEVY